jgi:16S rRNA (cytidine1402-2'-O)-methyltransferase
MGKLSVVATPIGNLDDITIRAIKTLFSADAILCEDTRRSGLLMQELIKRYGEQFDASPEWKPEFVSYYDEIEEKRLPELIDRLQGGAHLALISDAGTPLISDPGFRLVRECVKRGITVESLPGASALLAALTSSGLPADKFFFLGYPSEKQSQRQKLFTNLKDQPVKATYILYCAPHKLTGTLEDISISLGDIEIVVARELTKLHEEIWKGTVLQAKEMFANPKGEFVLLFNL